MSQQDHLELVRQARERLQNQELQDREAASGGGRSPGAPNPKDDKVLMYRGRVIRGAGGSAPGAPSGRGRAPQPRGRGGKSDAKAKLEQLTDLYNDGLLTKAEYDTKRAQVISEL